MPRSSRAPPPPRSRPVIRQTSRPTRRGLGTALARGSPGPINAGAIGATRPLPVPLPGFPHLPPIERHHPRLAPHDVLDPLRRVADKRLLQQRDLLEELPHPALHHLLRDLLR